MALAAPKAVNSFQKIVALSLLIISFSIAYYLVIFLPDKEKARQEFELRLKTIETERQITREKATAKCIEELGDQVKNTDLGKTQVSGIQEFKEIMDIYVDTCLKRKGIIIQ